MRAVLLVAVLALGGCFAPYAPAGGPCAPPGAGARCPSGQICVAVAGDERCQLDPATNPPRDTGGVDTPSDGDLDDDMIADADDNCPAVANPGQHNEDADLFGDACDPCPIEADDTPSDGDGDGVAGSCDPHGNLPDRIIAFESFHQGVPPGWTRIGTWSADNGSARVIAAAGELATLRLDAAVTDRTKITASVIVDTVAPGNPEIGVVDPMTANDGVGCLFQQPPAPGAARQLSIFDVGGGATVLAANNAWTEGTSYTLAMNRNTNFYDCKMEWDGNTSSIATNVAKTISPPGVGLRARGVTARVAWVLVVTTP